MNWDRFATKRSWNPLLACIAWTLVLTSVSSVWADEITSVSVSLRATEAQAYRYALTIRTSGATELVADRRLLELVFRPRNSRRAYRCRHPARPRAVDRARVISAVRGEWAEWFDLRMLCWAHRRKLSEGGSFEGRYGFARRGRRRWIARLDGQVISNVEIVPFDLALDAAPVDEPLAEEPLAEEPLLVVLRDQDVQRGADVDFRVSIRGPVAGPLPRATLVYLRDDRISFLVRGPQGLAECEVVPDQVVPIVDFFRPVGRGRAVRTDIEATRWCPHDTFGMAGIYEVTPTVDLVYDGSDHRLEATTGRFVGGTAVVRVRSGAEDYVERPWPQSSPAAESHRE